MGDRTHIRPGFPIRTPSDHSSFDSSPRPFAAYHVLHRLLVPRHPPCALKNLATKMLASTVQISNTHRLVSPHLGTTCRRQRDAVWDLRGDPVLKKTTKRLFLQDPTVCRTRTGSPRKRRADQVFDVPPLSAGVQTYAGPTGLLCTRTAHPMVRDP